MAATGALTQSSAPFVVHRQQMRVLGMAAINHTTSRHFLLPADPEGGPGLVSFRSERGHVPEDSRPGAGVGPYIHLPSGEAKLSFFNEQIHDVLHAAASGRTISDINLDLSPDSDVDLSWAWTNDTSGGYNLTGVGSTGDFGGYYYNLSAAASSGDNSTGPGHDDVFNWGMLVLAPLVLFGIAGNTLVILAISLERRLQNVTNYFLLSLAVTDLLVSLIVMPLSIMNEFTGRWKFGLELCNLFVTADVLMCTSSILHLCTISLERYVGIRYPLWAKNKSTRTVFLKIVLVWTLALAITSPITVLGLVSGDNIYRQHDQQCLLRNQHFIIYGSVLAFFIPLAIMVLMYALTVRMLNRQAKMCGGGSGGGGRGGSGNGGGSGEAQPMIRRSTSRRHWQRQSRYGEAASGGGSLSYHHPNKESLSATSSYPLGASTSLYTQRYQPLSKRNTVPLYPKPKRPLSASSSASTSRAGVSNGNASGSEYELCNGSSGQTPPSSGNSPDRGGSCWRLMGKQQMQHSNNGSGGSREPKRLRELVRKHHVAVKAANILLMRKDLVRKETNAVHTEQKASKVLGVVFTIFVVCWAPFFLMNVLRVLCPDSCALSPTLFTVFVWLGYVSSTLNPIIYTVFNKVFKLTFLKLLCCRYGHLHRGRRRSAAAAPPPASALARGRAGQSASSSGLITCSSFCGHGGSNSMEESMC